MPLIIIISILKSKNYISRERKNYYETIYQFKKSLGNSPGGGEIHTAENFDNLFLLKATVFVVLWAKQISNYIDIKLFEKKIAKCQQI